MRWFRHMTDAHRDPRFYRLVQCMGKGDAGFAAVGRYWTLLEKIADNTGKDEEESFCLPKNYGLNQLADELAMDLKTLLKFLRLLARIGLIDPEAWRKNRVFCPELTKLADQYAEKLRRNGKLHLPNFWEDSRKSKNKNEIAINNNHINENNVRPLYVQNTNKIRHKNKEKEELKKSTTPLTPPKGGAGGEWVNLSKTKGTESLLPAIWPDELMQAWNDYRPPELPEVTIGRVDRRRQRAIANAYKLYPELNWWRRLFAALGTVPRYIGEAEGMEGWKADFNWVLNHAQEAHEIIKWEGGYVEMKDQRSWEEENAREKERERDSMRKPSPNLTHTQ